MLVLIPLLPFLGFLLNASFGKRVSKAAAGAVACGAMAGSFLVSLVAVWQLPHAAGLLGVLAFALAGLGCSALLPLTISFGQEQLAPIATAAAGGVIAFYQLGYGIAAIGGGKLQDAGVALPTLFAWTAVVALVMGGLAFILARRPLRDAAPLDVSREM